MKAFQLIFQLIRGKENEHAEDYYITVLRWSLQLMLVYYVIYAGCFLFWGEREHAFRTLIWLVAVALALYLSFTLTDKMQFNLFGLIMISWSVISVHDLGWNVGAQHFLLPLLVLLYFCVSLSLTRKIISMLLIFALRMGLYFYSRKYTPFIELDRMPSIILQMINSITLFTSMTITCVSFSGKVQGAERALRNANEKLKAQASTDLLTNLPNRRYMLDFMRQWRTDNPQTNFSVAIADIDFFKKVNDTYGHECGDEVLKSIANLFSEFTSNYCYVCRWGGEEFLFFFPELNLDEARTVLHDLNLSIRQLEIPYQGKTLNVTITSGLEENDYRSDLMEIIRRADAKLYYGKEHGRNCVIS